MPADELNATARIRAHCRQTIADLRRLGVPEQQLQHRTVLELDDMLERAHQTLMAAPGGG